MVFFQCKRVSRCKSEPHGASPPTICCIIAFDGCPRTGTFPCVVSQSIDKRRKLLTTLAVTASGNPLLRSGRDHPLSRPTESPSPSLKAVPGPRRGCTPHGPSARGACSSASGGPPIPNRRSVTPTTRRRGLGQDKNKKAGSNIFDGISAGR